MITVSDKLFILSTKHTSYVFSVIETGHLEHLYYGRRLPYAEDAEAAYFSSLVEKHAFAPGGGINYDKEHPQFSLEDMRLEMSSYGKGDYREPFVEIIHADGSYTSDFLFDGYSVLQEKPEYQTLPGSYDESGKVEHLCVVLKDAGYNLTMELHYYVYEDCDVICRSTRLLNTSEETIRLTRLLSTQVDFETADFTFTTFKGAWAREMKRFDVRANAGKFVNSSYTGTTSSRANSFVMLSREGTTEDFGDCYGFHLLYSGNHYEAVDINSYEKTRIVTGINPQSFCFVLEPGDTFEAPEAAMAYSDAGFNGMSQEMHHFIKEHIVRGEWKKKARPVLLNSWEAAYFDFNEKKLLNLAKEGKEVGIELFVMDDGWFGKRDNDTCSLGDWNIINSKKLPNGVSGLAQKVNALGLDFGIWVEPEMVNTDSELYRAHPDWTLDIPGKPHSEGRNQRVLDLTRTDVQDYIIEQMCTLFSSANISYVKWDMNRTITDYYSKALPPERQGEVAHRYVMGLYRCLKTVTEKFPHILFEGCSAGGNRFDPGVLCYFPQIWGSDDTDAICRVEIQTGYSYGYPMSTVSAHVSSCPNHQTLRITPLATRFNVAAFGVFGYECNLCDMSKDEIEEIKKQIAIYKEWRMVLQYGDFYRGRTGSLHEWTCVSPDRTKAAGVLVQELVQPNTQFTQYFPKGLESEKEYKFYNRDLKYNVKEFGDLVNTVSPVHIKQNGFLHNTIAKVISMPGEQEFYAATGGVLMGGVKLKQGFAGTGYSDQVRFFQDFGSRIYFMEEV